MSIDEQKTILTLCMVCEKDRILLAMKKRGFGAGRFNGFGGKVEKNETIEAGARRELLEEAGIEPLTMRQSGILNFSFMNDPRKLEVHIFKVEQFSGEPIESEEMTPEWFSWDDVPYDRMWSDDRYWLPLVRNNSVFRGAFLFDAPATADHEGTILEYQLGEVSAPFL